MKKCFLILDCQKIVRKKLNALVKRPIKGINKVLIRSTGSNGLTELLWEFRFNFFDKRGMLLDKVYYFDSRALKFFNSFPASYGYLEHRFDFESPKVIILDNFQLFYENSIFWEKLLELIEARGLEHVLIVAAVNMKHVYDKNLLEEISSDFKTVLDLDNPTTSDIINLSEASLTDYNPIADLKHQLDLDLKSLVSEIEREAGYPANVSHH